MPEDAVIDPESTEGGAPLPQLTPVQQRFIEALRSSPPPSGAVPFTQVPYSGAQALQGFSAPGYTAAYQPAQSLDDPAYQKSIYEWEQEVRRKAEAARAEQAIQAGIRYIYQRRYDTDIKSGMAEPQAFSRMMMGIALHTPKSDPVKMFEAFRPRPAPQAQMMQFGTNQVPGVMNVDRFGAQRWTPIPASALPSPQPGEIITKYEPNTKRWFAWRNGNWYPATGEDIARLNPLQKAEASSQTKAYNEAAEALRSQAKRDAPNPNAVARATKDFQSASNVLQQLSVPKVSPTPKVTAEQIREQYRTGKLKKEDAIKALKELGFE